MVITISTLHINTKNILKKAGIADYRFEASQLLQHFIGIKAIQIATLGDRPVDNTIVRKIQAAITKRLEGYPLQYIIGDWDFYGLNFYVGEGVLIPRSDTEILVDIIIEKVNSKDKIIIADLCSGSGCIAIALEKHIPNAEVFAVENSSEALGYLQKNIFHNNSNVKLIAGDVLSSDIINNFNSIDILVSNPPYITTAGLAELQKEVKYEPDAALDGGVDGLFFYREIVKNWHSKLKVNGILAFEIGIGQENDVIEILQQYNFKSIETFKDLNGIIRVVLAVVSYSKLALK